MKYWERVLGEVLNKNDPSYKFMLTTVKEQAQDEYLATHGKGSEKLTPVRKFKKYSLGATYPHVYFTLREAQTIFYYLQGMSTVQVANALNLSRRTVEFYVKNMKFKLKCRLKSELIEKVSRTDFMKEIDFK